MENVIVIVLDSVYKKVWDEAKVKFCKGWHSYENAWAPGTCTTPSVGAMFSGMYPHDSQKGPNCQFLDPAPNIFENMKAQGYRTILLTAIPYLSKRFGLGRGIDKLEAPLRSYFLIDMLKNLERHHGPYFAWLQPDDTHQPYDTPKRIVDRRIFDAARAQANLANQGKVMEGWEHGDMKALWQYQINAIKDCDEYLQEYLPDAEVYILADHGENWNPKRPWGHGYQVTITQAKVPFVTNRKEDQGTSNDVISLTEIYRILQHKKPRQGFAACEYFGEDSPFDFGANGSSLLMVMGEERKWFKKNGGIEKNRKIFADLVGEADANR